MKHEDVKKGQIVAYVPLHAKGKDERKHPDVEFGIVSAKNENNVFVKFFSQRWKITGEVMSFQSQGQAVSSDQIDLVFDPDCFIISD